MASSAGIQAATMAEGVKRSRMPSKPKRTGSEMRETTNMMASQMSVTTPTMAATP